MAVHEYFASSWPVQNGLEEADKGLHQGSWGSRGRGGEGKVQDRVGVGRGARWRGGGGSATEER